MKKKKNITKKKKTNERKENAISVDETVAAIADFDAATAAVTAVACRRCCFSSKLLPSLRAARSLFTSFSPKKKKKIFYFSFWLRHFLFLFLIICFGCCCFFSDEKSFCDLVFFALFLEHFASFFCVPFLRFVSTSSTCSRFGKTFNYFLLKNYFRRIFFIFFFAFHTIHFVLA